VRGRDAFDKNKVKLPAPEEASGAGPQPAQGQLLRHGAELEPHGRLRRHAGPHVPTGSAGTKEGKYRSIIARHAIGDEVGHRHHKGSLKPPDLSLTGSGNNENFIAKNIAQTQRPQHHLP
jgi:hypothetical protein